VPADELFDDFPSADDMAGFARIGSASAPLPYLESGKGG